MVLDRLLRGYDRRSTPYQGQGEIPRDNYKDVQLYLYISKLQILRTVHLFCIDLVILYNNDKMIKWGLDIHQRSVF